MRARLQHYAGARFLLAPHRRRQVVKLLSEGNFEESQSPKNLLLIEGLLTWKSQLESPNLVRNYLL